MEDHINRRDKSRKLERASALIAGLLVVAAYIAGFYFSWIKEVMAFLFTVLCGGFPIWIAIMYTEDF